MPGAEKKAEQEGTEKTEKGRRQHPLRSLRFLLSKSFKTNMTTNQPEPKCDRSGVPIVGTDRTSARSTDQAGADVGRLCPECAEPPKVWCPVCRDLVKGSRRLWEHLNEPRPLFHAATLVVHYRFIHIKSWLRSLRSAHYAAAVPHVDEPEHKHKIDNRAKRQLLRALARALTDGAVPVDVAPRELAEAFGQLRDNDEKTADLVAKLLGEFPGAPGCRYEADGGVSESEERGPGDGTGQLGTNATKGRSRKPK